MKSLPAAVLLLAFAAQVCGHQAKSAKRQSPDDDYGDGYEHGDREANARNEDSSDYSVHQFLAVDDARDGPESSEDDSDTAAEVRRSREMASQDHFNSENTPSADDDFLQLGSKRQSTGAKRQSLKNASAGDPGTKANPQPSAGKKVTWRTKALFKSSLGSQRYNWPQIWKQFGFTRIVEVGVWKGDFAENSLKKYPAISQYTLVDPWRHLEDWDKPFNKGQNEFNAIFNQAMSKTRDSPAGKGKVRVLRGMTAEVVGKVADRSVDAIYVDGDHTLKGVLIDLILWYPKVVPGGLVCGDDYVNSLQHGSEFDSTLVKAAVDSFARVLGIQVKYLKAEKAQFGFIKPAGPEPVGLSQRVVADLNSKYSQGHLKNVLKYQDIVAARNALQSLTQHSASLGASAM